jgi:hypothetical protein
MIVHLFFYESDIGLLQYLNRLLRICCFLTGIFMDKEIGVEDEMTERKGFFNAQFFLA